MTIPLKKINNITTAKIEINFGFWGLWSFYKQRGVWELYAFGVNIYYWNILEVES